MIKALLLTLLTAAPAYAQTSSDICGVGPTPDIGCDAVRARTIVDAAQPPWHVIGRVNFASIDVRSHCTGTLIADDIVVTAAHCLFNRARKRWIPAESIRFVVGYQRGTHQGAANALYYTLPGDQDPTSNSLSPSRASDWALLVLDQPLRAVHQTHSEEIGPEPRIAGYPGIRPHVLSVAENCTPSGEGADIMVLNDCPIMQGDSGAPLVTMIDGQMIVLGIVSAVRSDGGNIQTLIIPAENWTTALDMLQR
ncbi:trypsin-like serine peptidase [Yoonia sp. 2307UL14-13]|uniref:trypsin-like serine peptidase n=1 Tax=Yoonia sp. 2307UL14-13 TaxID=3126506 RepID=UPI0030AEADC0